MRASGRCWPSAAASFRDIWTGLDEEFQRQEHLGFSATDAVLDYLDTLVFPEARLGSGASVRVAGFARLGGLDAQAGGRSRPGSASNPCHVR